EDRVAVLQSPLAPSGLPKRLSSAVLVRSGTRKLFLDAHKRFYLIVCELHCDVAGLPNANPAEVCETGFVVRRRACNVPQPIRRETAARHIARATADDEPGLTDLEIGRAHV